MDINKLRDLLRPIAKLTESQLQDTLMYIDILQKWNARVNLTAIRDPDEIVTRHFGESYFAAQLLLPEGWPGTVIDFGSGAGFPGIPIALLRPKAAVTLVESNGKKAAFLAEVVGQIGLKNVDVFRGRGEAMSGQADLVVMRAVESFEQAVNVAARLVGAAGRLGLLIGKTQRQRAIELLPHFSWAEPFPVPQSSFRILLVGKL
jgi:16S rRNA (guanine527-N7)-methyltransferase